MFRRRGNNTINHGRIQTLVGPGTEIKGTVQSAGVVRIDGRVEGQVEHDGTLIIGQKGRVEANVRTKHMAVAGEVYGKLFVEGRLELLPTARVHADLRCGHLVVHEGALFHGVSQMVHAGQTEANGMATTATGNHPGDLVERADSEFTPGERSSESSHGMA